MTRTCDSGARCATSLPKQLEFDGPSRWMVSTLEASTPSPRDYHTWGEGDRPPQCESAAVSLDADSHELVEDAPDLLGRVAVPERLRLRPLRIEFLDRVKDFVRLRPDEGVPAVLQGLDPFRLVAKCDARHAEEVRLLLDPAAIRHDLRRPHEERDEVQVVDRFDRLHLRSEAIPQVERDQILAGPRVDREHDRPPGVDEGLDDRREGPLVVHVLRAVEGDEEVLPSGEAEPRQDVPRPGGLRALQATSYITSPTM